jgi:hypothetical protein
VPRADVNAPDRSGAHRLFGVEQQVEQRLLQLTAVAEHRRQPGLEVGHQLYRLQVEFIGAQRKDTGHDVGDVLLGARRRLAAGERQQVADDARGPLRFLGDPAQIARELRTRKRCVRIAVVQQFLLE